MRKEARKIVKRTIKPSEDIVASMVEDFKKRLIKLIDQGIKDLTIDFKSVKNMDAAGLGILIATYNSLEQCGGVLKLKNVSEDLSVLLKTMRLDQRFEVITV